jgi:hypothetical protein
MQSTGFTFTVILVLALGSAGRPASRAPVANIKCSSSTT